MRQTNTAFLLFVAISTAVSLAACVRDERRPGKASSDTVLVVNSGVLVLHGHLLDPPYRIETVADTVWVNNILARPYSPPRFRESPSDSIYYRALVELDRSAYSGMKSIYRATNDWPRAVRFFRDTLEDSDLVVKVEESGNGYLKVYFRRRPKRAEYYDLGERVRARLDSLRGQHPVAPERRLPAPNLSFALGLRQGNCVLVGSGYTWHLPGLGVQKEEIIQLQEGKVSIDDLSFKPGHDIGQELQSPRRLVFRRD